MPGQQSFGFALCDEELVFLLGNMGVEGIYGLEMEHLRKLDDTQVNIAMSVAERALIARGFLAPTEQKKYRIPPSVFSSLGACGKPERTWIVSRTTPDRPGQIYYFHNSRKMAVMHTPMPMGIHQFITFNDNALMVKAVISLINPGDKKKISCPAILIDPASLAEIRKAVMDGKRDHAQTICKSQGVDLHSAEYLIQTYAKPVANSVVVSIDHSQADSKPEGFTIIHGEIGLWIMESLTHQDSPPKLQLVPVGSADATKRVAGLIR